jgi:hypothetical protein
MQHKSSTLVRVAFKREKRKEKNKNKKENLCCRAVRWCVGPCCCLAILYVCVYLYLYMSICICIYVYMSMLLSCMSICMCISICIYVYMYLYGRWGLLSFKNGDVYLGNFRDGLFDGPGTWVQGICICMPYMYALYVCPICMPYTFRYKLSI